MWGGGGWERWQATSRRAAARSGFIGVRRMIREIAPGAAGYRMQLMGEIVAFEAGSDCGLGIDQQLEVAHLSNGRRGSTTIDEDQWGVAMPQLSISIISPVITTLMCTAN